jgi:hypothetical protein
MFTSDERQKLELFCSVCDKAAGSRLVRTFFDQQHHICIGTLPDGRVVDEYPSYDDDDFRAFLTHYRKLRLNDEPTQLNRIINILKREDNSADRSMLDYVKNEIKEEGRCWWGSMHPAEGYTEELTQEWLEDRILNGEIFHSDVNKRHQLARVTATMPLPKAVAVLNYMRFAMTVLGCAQKVAGLIRERGYLGQG